MRHRLYGGVGGRSREAPPTRLENHANPNAEFDFRAVGSRNGTIIQIVMGRNDLNNTQLLVLYGGVPPLDNLQADFVTHVVATSASIDFKKRRELETKLASTLKHENMKKTSADVCEQLANFWEEQSKVNHQFPRGGNPAYQAHYQAKGTDYRRQKEQILEPFPAEKKGFFLSDIEGSLSISSERKR